MVSFLKGRRRTDDTVVAVDSSGSHITLALEALVARAEQAVEQLRALTPVLERSDDLNTLRERCEGVERQVQEMEGSSARLTAAEAQVVRVAGAGAEIDQLQARMGEFGDKIDAALKLREQIEQFLSLQNPIAAVRGDADGLRKQLEEMGEDVTRMRTQADDALRAHRHSTSRLEAFDEECQASKGRLDEVSRRVQAVEQALEPVGQAVAAVPDVQHRLAVLKALADQVSQKSAALEQQREAVDRAATQISQLTRLDRELDAWLRRQEEQIRRFGAIEAKIAEVQAVQGKVLARSDELQAMSQQTEQAQQAARQSLHDLREQMRKSSENFELENRGLHAVSERVADLRNGVKECETRFAVLDAASQGTAAVTAQVRSAGEEAATLSAELARLLEEEKRISSLRQEVGRLDGVATDVASRMQRIEELRPGIESAVKDLGSLKGTREMMADGLEQMRVAYEEMTRLRETHGEVETWLSSTDVWSQEGAGAGQGAQRHGAGGRADPRRGGAGQVRDDRDRGPSRGADRRAAPSRRSRRGRRRAQGAHRVPARPDGDRRDPLRAAGQAGRRGPARGRHDGRGGRIGLRGGEADVVGGRVGAVAGEPDAAASTSCRIGSGCSARSSTSARARSTRRPSISPARPRCGRKRPRRPSGSRRSRARWGRP